MQEMQCFETLSLDVEGTVATLTFNRPDAMNTFNSVMRREFLAAARQINLLPDVSVVLLTGAGRAFGAGADLAEGDGGIGKGDEVEDMLNHEYGPAVEAICDSPKIWIAAVNGPCAGITCSYALACDLLLISESAFLYQPFSAIGLVPDGGATWFLSRQLGHRRALEMMLIGDRVGAAQALEWGLANRVYPDAEFREKARAMALDMAARSPLAMRHTKSALNTAARSSLNDAISEEARLQSICIESDDCAAAVKAFFAKEKPVWTGK